MIKPVSSFTLAQRLLAFSGACDAMIAFAGEIAGGTPRGLTPTVHLFSSLEIIRYMTSGKVKKILPIHR